MIVVNNPDLGDWIAHRAGFTYNTRADVNFCRVVGNQPIGGVVFTNYTGASIFIHAAGDSRWWADRDMLWVTFHYPFVQLGVDILFGSVPSTKPDVIAWDKKLGFKDCTTLQGAIPNGDLVILSMRREDCRWLSVKPRKLGANFEHHKAA